MILQYTVIPDQSLLAWGLLKHMITGQDHAREQLFAWVCVVRYAAEVLHNGLVELCAAPRGHPADEHDVAAQPGVLCFYAPAHGTGPLRICCTSRYVMLLCYAMLYAHTQ